MRLLPPASKRSRRRRIDVTGIPEADFIAKWTIDTVAPDTMMTGGPSGSIASTTATFSFTSTEGGSTFRCVVRHGGIGCQDV